MTAHGATLAGRRLAESLMLDTVTITRATGRTFSESLGTYSDVVSTVYAGPARVSPEAPGARDVGQRESMVRGFAVSLPTTVTGVRPNDVVTVTASTLDPALVGTRLRVVSVVRGTHVTARRLACEAVDS